MNAAAETLQLERPVCAAEAARALGVSPKTVRQWHRDGAPCVRAERPALFLVSELQDWRKGRASPELVFEQIAEICLATHTRAVPGYGPAHDALRIDPVLAAGHLLAVCARAHMALFRRPIPDQPNNEAIKQLIRLTNAKGSFR